jgi:DNA processing protein
MALSCAADGGDPVIGELVDRLGAQGAWHKISEGALGEPLQRRAAGVDLDLVTRMARVFAIRFVVPGDEEWAEPLGDLRHCEAVQRRGGVPYGLWLRGPGHLVAVSGPSVAVVGSRACTSYGHTVTTDLAADLSEQGVAVVSGGAYGIDAAAHRGALMAGGPTVCVLANGVDVGYPRGNSGLIDQMARDHLLVSELPPGATPTRLRFLARNRIIAALSQGTVVVEAALRSGARNTVSWASECGRQVMAVPGPVHSTLSAAPHLMIRSGQATLVTGATDVLELISAMGANTLANPQGELRFTDSLDPTRMAVFEAVPARRRASVGEIALAAGVTVPVCLAELAVLEASGVVEGDDRGWRVQPGSATEPGPSG